MPWDNFIIGVVSVTFLHGIYLHHITEMITPIIIYIVILAMFSTQMYITHISSWEGKELIIYVRLHLRNIKNVCTQLLLELDNGTN